MKSLVIYTNCQGDFIYNSFLKDIEFFKNLHIVYIQNYKDELTYNDIECIKKADIFIYQPVSVKNGIKTTENENGVLQFVKQDCVRICFPSLYLDMWPIYEETGPYVGGDTIDVYENQGMVIEEILELYDTNRYNFNLQNRVNYSIEYMRRKEESFCNIKVVDFIEENYKKWKLFDTQNHPNGIVGLYVAKQICHLLGVKEPYINEFTCQHISVIPFKWPDSRYIKQELRVEFPQEDDSQFYKNKLFAVYKQPHRKKYK
jgi:hypothetical protein